MDTGPIGAKQVADMVADITRVTAHLEPDAMPDDQVKPVIDHLAKAQRLVEGALTMMARRTIDRADPKAEKRAAEKLSKTTGTTMTAAKRRLKASRRLKKQTTVADAVRRGELSGGQTEAITDTCEAAPQAQGELVDAAGKQSLSDLRQNCRDRHQRADNNRDATRHRHHQRRSLRSWRESDGEWRASLSAPADVGARFEAALRADHDAVFRAAHAAGQREDDACYQLDALIGLVERGSATSPDEARPNKPRPDDARPDDVAFGDPTADGDRGDVDRFDGDRAADSQVTDSRVTDSDPDATDPGHSSGHGATKNLPGAVAGSTDSHPVGRPPMRRSGRQTTVIVNIDIAALNRGRLAPGDRCRIEGVGEVSLAAVKALIPDAHLAYVFRDTVDIKSVVHLGRQATAHQRTALLARGYVCEVPHCNAAHLLEIDHTRDWAASHHTVIDELGWFCRAHHADKTSRGHQLQGPPGRRRWLTATGIEISRDPPPQTRPVDNLQMML